MLRAIALQNFKAFKRLEELELRPLTVFCGPNAVGKSSVVQALMMMQQTLNEQPEGESVALVANGDDVLLGDYSDVVFDHDLGRNLCVELTVPLAGGENSFWERPATLRLVLEYHVPHGYNPDQYRSSIAIPEIRRLCLAAREEDGRELVTVDIFRGEDHPEYTGGIDLTFGELMSRSDKHFDRSEVDIRLTGDLFKEATPDGVTLAEWDDDFGAQELVGLVSRMLYEVSSRLKVRFVGPSREVPQRYYDADAHEDDRTAELAERAHRAQAPKPPGFSEKVVRFQWGGLTNAWLRYLGLPEMDRVREGRDFRVMVTSPYIEEYSVSVADTGYGVSQALHVLNAGLAGGEETLVLDQPELHLHPKGQAGMADFAIAVATCRWATQTRQVLVETHSDHFVNRIVRRVVAGDIGSDDVAVYFVTPTSDGPHVESVEVDPAFGIKNWPLGFFDDYANDQAEILRASIERRSKGDE